MFSLIVRVVDREISNKCQRTVALSVESSKSSDSLSSFMQHYRTGLPEIELACKLDGTSGIGILLTALIGVI